MVDQIPTVTALAEINPDAFIVNGKTSFRGVGADMLVRFRDRASW